MHKIQILRKIVLAFVLIFLFNFSIPRNSYAWCPRMKMRIRPRPAPMIAKTGSRIIIARSRRPAVRRDSSGFVLLGRSIASTGQT